MPGWVFLRHGQSQANVERWLSGWVDSPLTDRGREQAAQARHSCSAWEFERAYSSDLSRAVDTAEAVLRGRTVPLVLTEELRERNMGQWARKSLDEVRGEGLSHRLTDWTSAPPGGESNAQLGERVLTYLAGLPAISGNTLIVAHGGLIRVVLGLIDSQDYSEIGKTVIQNCAPHFRELPAEGFRGLIVRHEGAFPSAGEARS